MKNTHAQAHVPMHSPRVHKGSAALVIHKKVAVAEHRITCMRQITKTNTPVFHNNMPF